MAPKRRAGQPPAAPAARLKKQAKRPWWSSKPVRAAFSLTVGGLATWLVVRVFEAHAPPYQHVRRCLSAGDIGRVLVSITPALERPAELAVAERAAGADGGAADAVALRLGALAAVRWFALFHNRRFADASAALGLAHRHLEAAVRLAPAADRPAVAALRDEFVAAVADDGLRSRRLELLGRMLTPSDCEGATAGRSVVERYGCGFFARTSLDPPDWASIVLSTGAERTTGLR